ncbi:hypothetical protein IHV25_08520 [Phaeovibrio sulfidiphilus]|uniref:Invasion associated locus B (IalB) protein n=1 Tax=Phaeovibrio sulfidiphilus TaxID=1220600 RepID=A0A8J6YN28_9PROT|nr:invasion associated locus B family protein [Phaeovibrio sulfidiphilus]MBE1237690.1 hypothetical protein [Phaeovibrio sulfidiphilus]
MRSLKTAACVLAGVLAGGAGLAPHEAGAQQISTLGVYNNWTAFLMMENNQKVCYIASSPTKDEGNYTRRGDIYALVTHRPADKQYYVVTIYAGYAYRPGSPVQLSVDQTGFELFTEGESAWAPNDMDKRIVQAMRKGNAMVVRGTSSRGTATKDTYSLRGVSAALSKINEACGVSN